MPRSSNPFELTGCATAIGSLPYTEPGKACSLVLRLLPEIPAWPQLPQRSFLENMYVQFSENFPGVVVEGERIYVDRSRDLAKPLEELYAAYLENKLEGFGLSPRYAAGFHAFLDSAIRPPAVKGQVTGPVSWGLAVVDEEHRPVLYDETLADALARHLRLKAAWQERELRRLSPHTIIFVDEPYMASFGSAFVSLPRERVIALLEEVFGGIAGLKGAHCCGNTDWSVLLSTSLDILSLDAYNYAQSLSLYPGEVESFLGRGGIIAWGIVPSDEEALAKETVASLRERLEEGMGLLTVKGISLGALREGCLLTPSCGLGSLSPDAASWALEVLAQLSREFRKKYVR